MLYCLVLVLGSPLNWSKESDCVYLRSIGLMNVSVTLSVASGWLSRVSGRLGFVHIFCTWRTIVVSFTIHVLWWFMSCMQEAGIVCLRKSYGIPCSILDTWPMNAFCFHMRNSVRSSSLQIRITHLTLDGDCVKKLRDVQNIHIRSRRHEKNKVKKGK